MEAAPRPNQTGAPPPAESCKSASSKRKHRDEESSEVRSFKKQHTDAVTPSGISKDPPDAHLAVLKELHPKYNVKRLSVISASKYHQRIDRAIKHLGSFDPFDMSIHPGVVLLYSRSDNAAKMIGIIEVVRRRLHESTQKWYQYNCIYDVETEVKEEPSVIEDTIMTDAGVDNGDGESDDDDDEFETMPSRFWDAVMPQPKTTQKPHMAIFLSRVPIPELQIKGFCEVQSNAAQIDEEYRKRKARTG